MTYRSRPAPRPRPRMAGLGVRAALVALLLSFLSPADLSQQAASPLAGAPVAEGAALDQLQPPPPPAPVVTLDPSDQLSFDQRDVGTSSELRSVTITNTGNRLLAFDPVPFA